VNCNEDANGNEHAADTLYLYSSTRTTHKP